MARFRYVGAERRQVSMLPAGTLRLVEPDELFDVPDEHWQSYACQPGLYAAQDEDPSREPVVAVLERVADDPQAAAEALAAEQASPNPRTTLVAKLERLTAPKED